MVNVAGIAVCLIFVLFIATNKNFNSTDFVLIALNILLGLFLGFDLMVSHALTPESVIAVNVISFLIFPTFFIYTLHLIRHRFSPKSILYLPSVLLCSYMLVDFYIIHKRSFEYAEFIYRYPTLIYQIFYKGQLILTIIGQIFVLRWLKRYQQEIRNEYSTLGEIELKWLRSITYVFLAITVLTLTSYLIYNFNTEIFDIELVTRIINAFSAPSLFFLSYKGIKLYTLRELQQQPDVPHKQLEKSKYSKSAVSQETLAEIYSRLQQLFEEERPYTEPQIQLRQIAQKLQVSTHSLSQAINQVGGMTFYDFVNRYRLEHFKRLLKDPDFKHYTILALGMESGFNSKASMNRVFKELTGFSPSVYQKSLQEDVSLSQ